MPDAPGPRPRSFPGLPGLIRPALPRRALWRSIAGTCLLGAGLMAVSAGTGVLAARAIGMEAPPEGTLPPLAQIFILAGYLFTWPLLWVTLRLFHRRPVTSLLGRGPLWPDYLRGLGLAAGFALAGALMVLASAGPPEPVPGAPLALIALAVPLLFVQTAAEEMVFRGYLLQQMAARFRSPLAWAVLPSVLFGVLHFNPFGGLMEGALVVFWAAGLGLVLALITARTGRLSAAMGIHFVNNVVALLLVGERDAMLGLAHWAWPQVPVGPASFVLVPVGLWLFGLACWKALPVPLPEAGPPRAASAGEAEPRPGG